MPIKCERRYWRCDEAPEAWRVSQRSAVKAFPVAELSLPSSYIRNVTGILRWLKCCTVLHVGLDWFDVRTGDWTKICELYCSSNRRFESAVSCSSLWRISAAWLCLERICSWSRGRSFIWTTTDPRRGREWLASLDSLYTILRLTPKSSSS